MIKNSESLCKDMDICSKASIQSTCDIIACLKFPKTSLAGLDFVSMSHSGGSLGLLLLTISSRGTLFHYKYQKVKFLIVMFLVLCL